MDRVEDKQIVVDGRPIRNRNEEKVGLKIDWQRQNGIVYKIFFAQVTKLISTGAIRRLEIEDLCHLEQMGSELLWEKFERNWESEKKRASLMSSENKKNNKANPTKADHSMTSYKSVNEATMKIGAAHKL